MTSSTVTAQPRTLIFVRDPGAAAALTPVARSGPALILAAGHARNYVRDVAIAYTEAVDDAAAIAAIDEWRPDVLLTGTSLRVRNDAALWTAARVRSIPAMALVDHWAHLRERFTAVRSFDRVPDEIAVMDERSRAELVTLGCPRELIVVTGQPAFDALLDVPASTPRDAPVGTVLFASEPIARDLGGAAPIDEATALRMLLDAAGGVGVTVRPHPREDIGAIQAAFPNVRIDRLPKRAAIGSVGAVIGVSSVFLVEAALAGRHVLSLDPSASSLARRFPYLIASARSTAEIRDWIAHTLARPLTEVERRTRNEMSGFVSGSTGRVWDRLASLASVT